jgi:hypothetical protein
VLVYLEQTQEADDHSHSFRSRVLEDLRQTGDFFSLGTALVFQVPSSGDRLQLTAWTREEPVPELSLNLEPPLRLRLIAGIPQVLTGPEKTDLKAFAARWAPEAGFPIALPLVAEPRTLVGAVVLLDAPPFDLEDEDFVLAWTQSKYTLIQSLHPRRRSMPVYSEAALMRTLEGGHAFLVADLDTSDLTYHCDRHGLAHHRVTLLVERALVELTGQHGAVLWRPPKLTALFVLPGRMDRDLLWHQIEVNLRWPEGYRPLWDLRLVKTPSELQTILGR